GAARGSARPGNREVTLGGAPGPAPAGVRGGAGPQRPARPGALIRGVPARAGASGLVGGLRTRSRPARPPAPPPPRRPPTPRSAPRPPRPRRPHDRVRHLPGALVGHAHADPHLGKNAMPYSLPR